MSKRPIGLRNRQSLHRARTFESDESAKFRSLAPDFVGNTERLMKVAERFGVRSKWPKDMLGTHNRMLFDWNFIKDIPEALELFNRDIYNRDL